MVATDVPGCREIVREGVTGLLVPTENPEALARAIARLMDDPELRQIKIVFLTSVLTKEEERAAGGQIGGQTIIAKPFRGDDLLRVVAEQLQA